MNSGKAGNMTEQHGIWLMLRCILGVMNSGRAGDMTEQHGIWLMLRVYVVGGNVLKCLAVQSFYADSWACVRVGVDVSERFPVNVELSPGCVMSSW